MFDRKGRGILAVLLILVLVVPAVGVLAAGNGGSQAVAAPAASPLTWTQVHQAPAGQYFYSIFFPTKDVGYAVSGPDWNNAQNGSGAPTYISKTTDGGKTWKSTAIANTDGWMRGITCTDANNCWVAGKVSARILRTTDGGATWKTINNWSGYPNWLWSAGWTGKGTTILTGTTCYDPADSQAVANWLRSTDGQIFQGVLARPNVYTCYVQWDIECPSPGVCYSAGKDFTWRTTDDGVTWRGTAMEPRTRQYGLSCTSASTCWIVGKSPWIRSTTDSGGSWMANAVAGMPSGGQFWDVAMLDNQTGYAAGCDNVATDNSDRCLGKGTIFKTEDGLTWLPIASPTTADIMDIWAFSAVDVYVVDWSGKIWHGTGAPPPTNTPTATATPSTGVVSGFAFSDLNDDALRNAGEPGVAGATLVLRQGRTEIVTAVTSADGSFRFAAIQPGQYTVEEKVPPAGFKRSLFLGTFDIQVNRELIVYVPHNAQDATATPTETPTATSTATGTPEPTATSTPTATSGPAVMIPGYLPIIVH
jgi:photosystem II stability/assembly factor-like uncharacterized protein